MIFFNLPALLCVGQWWMVVSRFSITKEPMLRDPAEVRLVYVAASSVAGAGEGLWAKTSGLAEISSDNIFTIRIRASFLFLHSRNCNFISQI